MNVFSSRYFQKRNVSSRVFTSLRTCKFLQFNVLCTSVHFVLSNQIFRFDNGSKLTAKFKSYSFEPMGKSLFEEDVVERGDQRHEEAKICPGRV